MSHEADRALHVSHLVGDGKRGLRTGDDGEDRVAALQKRPVIIGLDRHHHGRGFAGEPAAVYEEQDAAPVGVGWLKYVQRQRQAELATVNDIFSSLNGLLAVR